MLLSTIVRGNITILEDTNDSLIVNNTIENITNTGLNIINSSNNIIFNNFVNVTDCASGCTRI